MIFILPECTGRTCLLHAPLDFMHLKLGPFYSIYSIMNKNDGKIFFIVYMLDNLRN